MANEQMLISKGPDKWLLAESLFHDDEFSGDGVTLRFTVEWKGTPDVHLIVSVDTIGRVRNEEGLYLITGKGTLRGKRDSSPLVEYVPLKIHFSVRSRKGVAHAEFQ